MTNVAAIRAKTKAHNICQECGSTELIQTHHRIPGDDSTIDVLCGDCHSRKHPEVPKALFLSVIRQHYWFNKSAAAFGRDLGVHPRTVIRAAKRLEILPGDELSPWDEQLIRNNIPKLTWGKFAAAAEEIGIHHATLYRWAEAGKVAFVRFGGIMFIPVTEVERLKKERNNKAAD